MPSEKVLKEKQDIVKQLVEDLKSAAGAVLVDYRGLSVAQDTQLRNELRKQGVEYHVVKNTLLRFASKETGLEELEPFLHGPTALAISTTDCVAPAKVLCEYAKKNKVLEIKCGVVEGKIVGVAEVSALSQIPPKEVLIAKALGGLNAPITGFVNVLNGNIRGLVVALQAIADKQSA